MTDKTLPFSQAEIESVIQRYPTPFHLYDEAAIRSNARRFLKAFSWVPGGFRNYFAVKALPNPYILKLLAEEGMGADCSSLPEIVLAEKAGLKGESILFTSNDTPADEYRYAKQAGAILNLDDISHIDFLKKAAGLPSLLCFRYNPGPLKHGNALIGTPEEAKYGFTRPQIIEGYRICKALGVKRFGLHTMVASNELNEAYFVETAKILFHLALEIYNETGISLEFVNLGGGIGIPYRPDQTPVNIEALSDGIRDAYRTLIQPSPLRNLRIIMECGRMVTGPYGYLVTTALHRKETYKTFIGLDACMADLMRPALYGAYHHVTVLGRQPAPSEETVDITGSLCENNDKFAINRRVPKITPGDIVIIHDTGAHGRAMGFNYNGKLRSAELLLKSDRSVVLIRRAETIDDYFATLDFSRL